MPVNGNSVLFARFRLRRSTDIVWLAMAAKTVRNAGNEFSSNSHRHDYSRKNPDGDRRLFAQGVVRIEISQKFRASRSSQQGYPAAVRLFGERLTQGKPFNAFFTRTASNALLNILQAGSEHSILELAKGGSPVAHGTRALTKALSQSSPQQLLF
jgi:hypothetical protein